MRFTSEQIDKMMTFAEQNFSEDALPLPIKFDDLKSVFNAEMQAFLDKCPFNDAEETEVMETLFLIKEFCQIFESAEGKFFFNVFGDRTAILGVSSSDDDRFKLLTCAYTTPETKDENTLSSIVLANFAKILLPAVDVEKFLLELSATATKIQDGVRFSIAADDKLIFVTATAE